MKELWYMSSDRGGTRLVLLECGAHMPAPGSERAERFTRSASKRSVSAGRRLVLLSGGGRREAARGEDALAGSPGREPDGAA
jgi:hypothetical protein